MSKDTRSRKWQITINNPLDKGFNHQKIQEELTDLKSCVYWCLCDEVGENGTYHTHVYVACENAVRFSTMQKKFDGAHFEMAKGTSQQNKDYIKKEGKWENDKKKETNLLETFEEFGEMPIERQGQRNDLNDLYDMIKHGYSNFQILEENPSYMLQIDKLERVRQIYKEELYKNTFRQLSTTYIFGTTGSGKTRFIMETYGYENVYRITDYEHPFDSYKGQDIIMFEEFRSDLKISDMLKYLDGYPVELPCRYNNKVACFTKIYIITNIPLKEQYRYVQEEQKETWRAFLRRINEVLYFTNDTIIPLKVNI